MTSTVGIVLTLLACAVDFSSSFRAFGIVTRQSRVSSRLSCNSIESSGIESLVPVEITTAGVISNGVVLLAQPSEYNHFLIKAAVLVFDYGTGRGSRGVILERATAFTMGETSPNCGPFGENTLYLGGEDGSDKAIMFHKYSLDGFSKHIGSGIYTGGLGKAQTLINNNEANPKDFKFIFNSVEWGPDQLEAEIKAGRWDVANVPPDLILQQSSAKASLWSKARNRLRTLGGLTGDDSMDRSSDSVEEEEIDEKDENSYA